MSEETANIHLGSRSGDALRKLLTELGQDRWFPAATDRMVACTRKDHAEWARR